jgi:hypothetical protein
VKGIYQHIPTEYGSALMTCSAPSLRLRVSLADVSNTGQLTHERPYGKSGHKAKTKKDE